MSNQKFVSGFLLGAAAGAVLTIFLQGEKGQSVIRNAKLAIKDASGELKSGIENIDETLERWVNRGRNLISEIRGQKEDELYDIEEIFS